MKKVCFKQRWVQRRAGFGCAALALWCVQIASQAQVVGPEVVVTASRLAQPLSDVLPALTLITRDEIERSQARSLADLLSGEPGFEFGRNGGPAALTSFFLRGQKSANLVVMVDGVRQMVNNLGQPTALDVPLSQIERIELLRGNASALYGDGAVGGVLQIFTRSPGDTKGGVGQVSVGSDGWVSASAGHGASVGDWKLRLDANAERASGFSAMDPVANTRVNPDDDGHRRENLSGRWELKLPHGWAWGGGLSASRLKLQRDDGSSPSAASDRHESRREQEAVQLHLRGEPMVGWMTRLDWSGTRFDERDFRNGLPNRVDYDAGLITGRQSQWRWTNELVWAPVGVLSFGAELGEENYTSDAPLNTYEAQRALSGIYLGVNRQMDAWSLQGNWRHDRVEVNNRATATSRNLNSQSTGLLGLGYQIDERWRLTTSYATAFLAPSAYAVSTNTTIRPETSRTWEAGLELGQGPAQWRLVWFDSLTRDVLVSRSVSPWDEYNGGEFRSRGLELNASFSLGPYRLKGTLVRQQPRNTLDGTRPARRADVYGSLALSRAVGASDVSLKLQGTGHRRDSEFNTTLLPGYATLDLAVSHKLAPDWTLRFKVDNLLDKRYQLAAGFNTPGRQWLLTLQHAIP